MQLPRVRAFRVCRICGRLSSGTRKPPRRKRGGPSRSYLLCAPLGCWQASRSPASLRVSPCQYQRRVVGTTFTTTAALLRCIFIISCFLPFVKPPFYGLGMRPQARRFHPAPRISQNMGASWQFFHLRPVQHGFPHPLACAPFCTARAGIFERGKAALPSFALRSSPSSAPGLP